MKKEKMITGLDIGSSKIAAVAAEIQHDGEFNIVAQATGPSKGIRRGVPSDLNEAVESASKVLAKLRGKLNGRPGDIYVNISGQSIKGSKSRGMIPLSLRGREVIKPDMDRCVGVASTISLPFNREIIHRVVSGFAIDDQPWIKSPIGLFASRLNCEVFIVSADINHIQNIYKCVNSSGYDIKELVYTGIADAACFLDKDDKESCVALVDMGASLTELSVFSGGNLCGLEIIPAGADDMKGAFKESGAFNDLAVRISSRAQSFTASTGAISSIILLGGFSFKDGVVEALEERIPFPIKMGVIKDVRGDISSLEAIRSATAIGLCKYARDKYVTKTVEEGSPIRRFSTKVVDIFNNYF